MAITTRTQLASAITAAQNMEIYKGPAATQSSGRYRSYFRTAGRPTSAATAPTSLTGAAYSSATTGAMLFANPVSGQTTHIAGLSMNPTSGGGALQLIDLLVETGGINSTLTTAQTVNSAALPARATGGPGVDVALISHASAGVTASPTVTISYTNQSGTAGRTGTVQSGVHASAVANDVMLINLETPDTGVRSVESVTFGTSTGTAGNFGIWLYRRIVDINLIQGYNTNLGWAETGLATVPNDACLTFMFLSNTQNAQPAISGTLTLIQG